MFQKRCMVINDISGIGRCSLGAILPILAMFDIECVNVPTAVLSSSTAYSNFVMKDMSDFAAFNEVYAKYFTGKPARSCVAVAALPKGALVEVEVVAEI